ncbi:hypothetical protein tb265_12060 [Gemmatimonadetes bacterium T265]|nr:hypothetical protein tb265_12060 [Gemmatimonadetes bacterium T265]
MSYYSVVHCAVRLTFVETPLFASTAKGVLSDAELRAMQDALLDDPQAGAVVRGTGGARKLRVALPGGGKSGGARVLYVYAAARAGLSPARLSQERRRQHQRRRAEGARGARADDPRGVSMAGTTGRITTVNGADVCEAVTVTSENFEALLLASAGEAAAIARGAAAPARTTTRERTERDTTVAPPPAFTRADVQALRARLRVSQGVFARLVGVSPKLEQAWELGTRVPNGPAARVLEVLAARPQAFQRLIRHKASTKPAADRRATR